jgi:hypothetical protein
MLMTTPDFWASQVKVTCGDGTAETVAATSMVVVWIAKADIVSIRPAPSAAKMLLGRLEERKGRRGIFFKWWETGVYTMRWRGAEKEKSSR